MNEYLLGIDNGLTVAKAAIFDLDGREVAVASRRADAAYPHPGWTECDMGALWRNTAAAIREAIEAAGLPPEAIVGVGCTGHGNGLYALDRQGAPARPGILSLDTRASDVVAGWNARDLHAQAFPATLQSFWPAQPTALLAWLKQHEPKAYAQIGAVLMCKDYVTYCLTGQSSADYSDMSATSLLDVRSRRYSAELLELFGIPEMRSALPPLSYSHELVGQVTAEAAQTTGLRAGTPVACGIFDVSGCALGAGVIAPGQACIVAGTWSINEIVTAEPIVDPRLFMTTIYTPNLWMTVESSATSATNLEWFAAQCCGEEQAEAHARGVSVYTICAEKVASLPPSEPVPIFHPFLFGSNVQPSARAGFYGIAGWHTKAHLLRALFEGVAFSHLSHIEKLRASGAQMQAARFTGGGARSEIWTQMFADVLDLPIEVPAGTQVGARGAAICAGIGIGVYNDYADGAARAVTIERRHEPNPAATATYRARYAEYRRLLEAMQEPWERLSRLQSEGKR
jgi:L-xylulokinase